jgi:DNA polymerase I-like protein with 3'-5' exonuclease and polymerase domains
MKNVLFLDCEATIYEKGHPFSKPNKLMCVGTLFNDDLVYHDIEYSGLPYNGSLESIARLFKEAELVVGFNIKYDLHWIRKYIPDIVFPRCWDCQLAEFVLSNQTYVYPSLEQCSATYDLPPKLLEIEDLYWKQGIDTTDVPLNVLKDRVLRDVEITADLYKKQVPQMNGKLPLFKLQCDDLLTLQEMEFNGMLFDEVESLRLGEETKVEEERIKSDLKSLYPDPFINFNSGDHLSAILYGGSINYESKETVTRVLKKGTISVRERKCVAQKSYPRQVDPFTGSEVKDTRDLSDKDIVLLNATRKAARKPLISRTYYTNEGILRSLPVRGQAKKVVQWILGLSNLEKLSSTYYFGIPKLITTMAWEGGLIHGVFNQVVARTGRLSSSKPNLQNFAGVIKPLFRSRYG